MSIRKFNHTTDKESLRDCVIELQDFERAIDDRIPPGAEIADDYILQMFDRCKHFGGQILVADADGDIGGYVTVLTKMKGEEIAEGGYEYGLIADIVVLERYRQRGFGRQLLEAAEAFAKKQAVKWLRIDSLASNVAAGKLYESSGFSSFCIEFEKDLSRL